MANRSENSWVTCSVAITKSAMAAQKQIEALFNASSHFVGL
jgi:hypothetical protein